MMKTNTAQKWDAFGYARVSKDDRDKSESNSIKNQRDMILDFAERYPDVNIINIVADDGATGANFDRNAFKDMINHIESGAVNCVVVKDFSRLGRDHIETGKYIERYFAAKKVRFISINDGYDSLHADMSDSNNSLIVPFKNIINEAFLEDISIKTKSQLAIKRKNGEFVCNYATFGYVKSPDKKLIIDEYAAEVVKTIFEHKLMGYNELQIANMLNAKGIHSPAEYKKVSGEAYSTPFAVNEKSLWAANTVKRILTNRVYIGHLEQGKRTKASYRVKKYFYTPRETWSIHENNHEPIINKYDFELVQELLAKDTRISVNGGQLHLFSGIIICGYCNQPMTAKTIRKNSGRAYLYYVCTTHKRYKNCRSISINSENVEKYTLLTIRKQVEGFISPYDLTANMGLDELKSLKKSTLTGMIEKSLLSIQAYNDYLVKSYAHRVDGVISQREYDLFRSDFRKKIDDAEAHIVHLQGEIARLEDNVRNHELIERFKSYGNITELNRRIVVGFVHSIIVYGSKDMEIRFRYENELSAPPHVTSQERRVV
ncbi:MAG: recombinase family protein [Defluviitaleaceae bacterium]|nr:recombinase family protein [Defluviitaleaceae bacterium]MCL2275140.1 recombinase family protein [Defluviitaleaceae bacterium]